MAVNPDIDLASGFCKMTLDDVPEIMQIEESIYSHPWTEGIFGDCIRVGYPCWVYRENNEILAYGLVSVAANEAHILNLCVSPHAQGRGLGKRMLHKMMQLAEARDADCIFLEVRVSNNIAQNLYEQEGFNHIGVRKAYYPSSEGREDALVYAKALNLDKLSPSP